MVGLRRVVGAAQAGLKYPARVGLVVEQPHAPSSGRSCRRDRSAGRRARGRRRASRSTHRARRFARERVGPARRRGLGRGGARRRAACAGIERRQRLGAVVATAAGCVRPGGVARAAPRARSRWSRSCRRATPARGTRPRGRGERYPWLRRACAFKRAKCRSRLSRSGPRSATLAPVFASTTKSHAGSDGCKRNDSRASRFRRLRSTAFFATRREIVRPSRATPPRSSARAS